MRLIRFAKTRIDADFFMLFVVGLFRTVILDNKLTRLFYTPLSVISTEEKSSQETRQRLTMLYGATREDFSYLEKTRLWEWIVWASFVPSNNCKKRLLIFFILLFNLSVKLDIFRKHLTY
ncbi:hypothetical protein B0A66_01465 [Flavobacterium hercynium]|uniref:Uncharacterized protein n=1 Tax=Flavobacterium hercynium TaxID=387094 RepID=A0A226HPL7_9FLAO|nr:hypothetical protein B0A66_01465 [Flavobacterium hercynium]